MLYPLLVSSFVVLMPRGVVKPPGTVAGCLHEWGGRYAVSLAA